MGFAKDLANVGTFGLAGALLGNKKKKTPAKPQPTMISSPTTVTPFINGSRGY